MDYGRERIYGNYEYMGNEAYDQETDDNSDTNEDDDTIEPFSNLSLDNPYSYTNTVECNSEDS